MSNVTEQEIQLSNELAQIGNHLEGVRGVQQDYGNMPTEDFKTFLLCGKDQLQNLKTAIDQLIQQGTTQEHDYILFINSINNPVIWTDEHMKNMTIDEFKNSLPEMEANLSAEWEAKKAELDAL